MKTCHHGKAPHSLIHCKSCFSKKRGNLKHILFMNTSSFRVSHSEKFRKRLKPHHELISENGCWVTLFCQVHKKEETLSRRFYSNRKYGCLCCSHGSRKQNKKTHSSNQRCENVHDLLANNVWTRYVRNF